MVRVIGSNTRTEFINNANRFVMWEVIGSYNVYESTVIPPFFDIQEYTIEKNDNEYVLIRYYKEDNGQDAIAEIAFWIKNNF